MLDNIHIKNFRGIRELELEGFQQINVFDGDNNACKTTILEALSLLNPNLIIFLDIISLRERGKTLGIQRGNNVHIKLQFDFLDRQFHNRDISKEILIEGRIGKTALKITSKLTNKFLSFEQIKADQDDIKDHSITSSLISNTNSFLVEYYEKNKRIETLGLTKQGTAKLLPNKELNSSFPNTLFISDIKPFIPDIFQLFSTVTRDGKESYYVEILKSFEPLLRDIKQSGEDLLFDIGGNNVALPYMGSGFLRVFSILLYLERLKNSHTILCIDEIDNGLYHEKQELFWNQLMLLLQKPEYKNIQIFTTTHSYGMIKALSAANGHHKDVKIKLFNINKQEDDNFLIGKYDEELLGKMMDSNLEVR
jgi:AAA15 family ATPase/GTPase